MSDIAITCENLGKKYRIGQRERYKALRDIVTDALYAPFRYLRVSSQYNSTQANVPDETFWALKDVSFEVKHGEVVGVIGPNGAGKSTLLKILSRITKPTEGQVRIHGRVGSLLEVGTGFHPELTGRENIFLSGTILGMKKREIQRKFDEIIDFAEIERFLDTPVKRYSSGMYVRLAFAVAAYMEPEILVIDEVLAVGDAAFQKKCLGKIGNVAKNGRTVIFVSHDMTAIQNLCSRVIRLDKGRAVSIGPAMREIEDYLSSRETTREINANNAIALTEGLNLSRFEVTPNPVMSTKPLKLNLEMNSASARIRELLVLIYDSLNRRVGVLDLRCREGMYKISEDAPLLIEMDIKSFSMVEGNYYLGLWVNADLVFSDFYNLINLSVIPNATEGLAPYHPRERGVVELNYEFRLNTSYC